MSHLFILPPRHTLSLFCVSCATTHALALALSLAAFSRVGTSTHALISCTSAGGAFLDHVALSALAARVAPGGAAEIREVVWNGPADPNAKAAHVRALRDAEGLRKAMLYAGLSPSAAPAALEPLSAAGVPPSSIVAALYPELAAAAAKAPAGEAADALAALGAQLLPLLAICVVRGAKPAAQAFSLKSRKAVAVTNIVAAPSADAPMPPAAAPNLWASLAPANGASGDVELLDEDDLLEEADLVKKEAQEMDCGTGGPGGKRKACKNCSCGLREMLDEEAAGGEAAPPAAKSACGNCSKGDAFRCAGCPHLGKPAFEPGDELKLSGTMLQGDAASATIPVSEAHKVVGGGNAPAVGGVVQLSLDDTMDDIF